MESSISSKREPPAQQAGETTDGTHDGPRQLPKLTEIALTQNTNSVTFCSRCVWFDFNDIFSKVTRSSPDNHKPTYSLHLGRLKKEASCVLCRFFHTMRYHPFLRDDETVCYSLQSYPLGSRLTRSVTHTVWRYAPSMVLFVLPSEPNLAEHSIAVDLPPPDRYWIIPQSLMAAPFFGHAKPGLSALPFSPTVINYPLLRAWCEHCDTHHSTCASATNTKHRSDEQGVGPAVRCIDCHTREIIEIATSDRFFALSYVWGEQPAPGSEYAIETRGTASTSGVRQLPNVIPKVIEDAIFFVANLGERYLWVDQYCIDQNDVDDKHAQIGNMAAIYEGAYATIVAFSATDSACGLPGVRNLARKPYFSVAHPKHSVSALRPSAISSEELVTSSVWMTRGWTYQEAILSRRLLIVTDYQVEFICSNAVWHECTLPGMGDGPLDPSRSSFPFLRNNLLAAITPRERSAGKIPVHINELGIYIGEYSRRYLTYQFDYLDAITGLLSRIPTITYLGIPILDQFELDANLPCTSVVEKALWQFLISLTWYPAHEQSIPLQRRYAFPSWSWLGWEGEISFPHISTYAEKDGLRPRDCASVWIANQVTHTKGETLVPLAHFLEEQRLNRELTSILPHLTNYLWVEGQVVRMTLTIYHRTDEEGLFIERIKRIDYPPRSGRLDIYRGCFRNRSPDQGHLNLWTTTSFHERTFTEQWDCLLLGATKGTFYFLILDQVQRDENTEAEDCYYAVGSAQLQDWWYNSHLLSFDPSPRRRIKLC
ncbi:heterokaryon incompatibility protein-domain-containing protein [Neurospora crassa]|nr:heterokaryon incompatibility protein-domain-containing protein [Neurospora crassa]